MNVQDPFRRYMGARGRPPTNVCSSIRLSLASYIAVIRALPVAKFLAKSLLYSETDSRRIDGILDAGLVAFRIS